MDREEFFFSLNLKLNMNRIKVDDEDDEVRDEWIQQVMMREVQVENRKGRSA